MCRGETTVEIVRGRSERVTAGACDRRRRCAYIVHPNVVTEPRRSLVWTDRDLQSGTDWCISLSSVLDSWCGRNKAFVPLRNKTMLQIGASLQVAAAVLDQGTRVEADFEIVPRSLATRWSA